jgi:hypothetical protein
MIRKLGKSAAERLPYWVYSLKINVVKHSSTPKDYTIEFTDQENRCKLLEYFFDYDECAEDLDELDDMKVRSRLEYDGDNKWILEGETLLTIPITDYNVFSDRMSDVASEKGE